MVKRICPKCHAIFNRKFCYDRHINKKFICCLNKGENESINDEKNDEIFFCRNLQEFAGICRNEKIVQKNEKIVQKNNELFIEKSNFPDLICINNNSINSTDLSEINSYSNDLHDTNYCCFYCKKNFSSKYTLSRHINENCKIKKENEEEKENIFKLLLEKDKQHKEEITELKKYNKEEISELKKQNKLLMDRIDKLINLKECSKSSKITNNNQAILNNNQSIIHNNQSITNNNLQNNFIMVNFGKEDLSIIDERLFIDRIIKKTMISGVKIPDEVLKIIHFNPMYPQLSNIYISDINREKCMVYEEEEWKLSNIDNIPQIMDKICLFSNDQINILKTKYPNNKALHDRLKVIEKYNNMIDNDYIEDLKDDENNNNKVLIKRCEDFQKNTYNTLKKTLYNEGKKLKKNIRNVLTSKII